MLRNYFDMLIEICVPGFRLKMYLPSLWVKLEMSKIEEELNHSWCFHIYKKIF